MKRVIGLGGVFIKAKDPKALYEWYRKHLGIESSPDGGAIWRPQRRADHPELPGFNIFSVFPQDTQYFVPSHSPFMLNFRVENLDELLNTLRAEGVEVDAKVEHCDYGNFGWVMDPEGNRIELWEPPAPGDDD